MTEKGVIIVFDNKECRACDKHDCQVKGKVLFTGTKVNAKLDFAKELKPMETAMLSMEENHNLWHRRLGHLSKACMQELRNGMATGLDFQAPKDLPRCMECLKGKQNTHLIK